jgi:hypothetical protein
MRLGAHRLHQGGKRLSRDPRALSNASRILTGAAPVPSGAAEDWLLRTSIGNALAVLLQWAALWW